MDPLLELLERTSSADPNEADFGLLALRVVRE